MFVDQRLHDFDVGVTHARDLIPVPKAYPLCGSFAGIAGNGQNVAISCKSPSLGQYVTIQIIASQAEYLTMCEVKVFGSSCEYKCCPSAVVSDQIIFRVFVSITLLSFRRYTKVFLDTVKLVIHATQ